MKKQYLGGIAILGATLMLTACGGGGGGGTGSSGLSGSWKGIYDIGSLYEMDVVVNGTSITSVSLGGTSTGDTGSFSAVQSNIYEYVLTPSGGYGGFLADSSETHAALLDLATPGFAVLQKGATSLTTFSGNEVAGSWSGYYVHLDALENIDNVGNSSVTVSSFNGANWSFSGTGPSGAFTGSFTVGYTAGIWYGTYTVTSSAVTGDVWVYLAPDGTFAASWACDYGATPPSTNCSYNSWTKQ